MAKNKQANCRYLLTKDRAHYPEGYCLKKVSALYQGINRDCGRDCLGSVAKRHMKAGKES